MGLFTSKCPQCDAGIDWFLVAPTEYICKCGVHVPPNVIEESWRAIYDKHLKDLIRADIEQGADKAELLSRFNEKMVTDVLAESITN